MKTVSEVLAQKNSRPTLTGEQKQVINALFGVIKASYPHFLKDQDEGVAKRLWAAHLTVYPREKIEAACEIMIDHYPTFPPTIGEFKKLIAGMNEAKPAHVEYKRLPAPNASPEVARENLERMRGVLK